VVDLLVEGDRVAGVQTQMGLKFRARAIVLTTGTFLGGLIHIGLEQHQGGRAGDPPSNALAERLRALPFRVGRLKTGTPPRIDGRSVDFSVMEVQPGDEPTPCLSLLGDPAEHPRQVPCHITSTNEQTHEIIRGGLDRSPLYSGVIEGAGPRYCPSIEDKVVRFAERNRHQVFVEPEGLDTPELYPNGISTSLPFDIQLALVRSIRGFERAHITRPGYAIEYDYFDPRDLQYSLETRVLEGLFFAGQINGTTGYEEAAAQGLLAGINAARKVAGQSPWWPERDQAYIGVLVDDLVTLGTNEPYRMFTSRAEYRLRLREDNADLRLTAVGRQLGVVGSGRASVFADKVAAVGALRDQLAGIIVQPGTDLAARITALTGEQLARDVAVLALLKRPNVAIDSLIEALGMAKQPQIIAEQVEIEVKYEGYIKRQDEEIARVRRHATIAMPVDFNYNAVDGLSNELRQKLSEIRPESLARAARIPGMTPAALSLLLVHARKQGGGEARPEVARRA